jgi:hypothetical protein
LKPIGDLPVQVGRLALHLVEKLLYLIAQPGNIAKEVGEGNGLLRKIRCQQLVYGG